jgi:DNA polymerase
MSSAWSKTKTTTLLGSAVDLLIDIETTGTHDLTKVGVYRYAMEGGVLLFGYRLGGVSDVIDLKRGAALPRAVDAALRDPTVTKWAHNASFERVMLERCLGVPCPPEQWRCTAVWARYLGLPASLAGLAAALRLESGKLADGKRLIRRFCIDRDEPSPLDHDWDLFIEYCARDVALLQEVKAKLSRYPMPAAEWALWALDQRINDRGLPVDVTFAHAAQRLAAAHTEERHRVAQGATGLANPNSRVQMMGWLERQGVPVEDLRAGTVADTLARPDLPYTVRAALECRVQTSATSLSKYDAFLAAACHGRVRGSFQFYGASRTGRWAGRLVQPHNLPRGSLRDGADIATARDTVMEGDLDLMRLLFDDVSGALSSLVRSIIAAPPGLALVVADYSSIESVMLAWSCGSEYLLDLFRQGRDPYKDFASVLFGVPYEQVTKAQRNLAKPAVLGGGYGLSGKGLQAYALSFGLDLTLTESKRHIDAFRARYADIPAFWRAIEDATQTAVREKTAVSAGHFRFAVDGPYLMVSLPSGRDLTYYKPRLELNAFDRVTVSYEGAAPGRSPRVKSHPGLWVENLVQAVARDVLAHGLRRANADPGLEVVGHVHDEILCLADIDDADALPRLERHMADAPPWCADAPISAKGWTGAYYRKD